MYFNVDKEVEYEIKAEYNDGVVEVIVKNTDNEEEHVILEITSDGIVSFNVDKVEDAGLDYC